MVSKNTVLVADLEGSNNLKNNFYKYRGNRNNLTILARKQNFLAKNIKIFCLEACDEENGSIFTNFLEENTSYYNFVSYIKNIFCNISN